MKYIEQGIERLGSSSIYTLLRNNAVTASTLAVLFCEVFVQLGLDSDDSIVFSDEEEEEEESKGSSEEEKPMVEKGKGEKSKPLNDSSVEKRECAE